MGHHMSGTSVGGAPHPDVLREFVRLGGSVDADFEPEVWIEDTPLGPRPVPPALQAILAVRWPDGHVLRTEEDGYLMTFPQLVDTDPMLEDRALFVIAFSQTTQYYWVVDLDDERPDDPMVHDIDHGDADEGDFDQPQRLSALLATLVSD